jgi:hypothetical protein
MSKLGWSAVSYIQGGQLLTNLDLRSLVRFVNYVSAVRLVRS